MSSFNEEQVLESRLNDYQQSVLSVMGISQWRLRSITNEEEQTSDSNGAVSSTDEGQQEKKVASVGALRDVLSAGSKDSNIPQATEDTKPSKATSPGLNPVFHIAPQEKLFVDSVVSAVAEGIQTSVEWSITDSLSLSNGKLETSPVTNLMNNPTEKKQLWKVLQTLL